MSFTDWAFEIRHDLGLDAAACAYPKGAYEPEFQAAILGLRAFEDILLEVADLDLNS